MAAVPTGGHDVLPDGEQRAGESPARPAKTLGQALAFFWSVRSRAHLRQAGSENESDGALRWSTQSLRPARTAARSVSAETGPLAGSTA